MAQRSQQCPGHCSQESASGVIYMVRDAFRHYLSAEVKVVWLQDHEMVCLGVAFDAYNEFASRLAHTYRRSLGTAWRLFRLPFSLSGT